jgi:hypothetical protein
MFDTDISHLQNMSHSTLCESQVDDLERELRIARKEIINLKDEIALLQSELAACKKNCLKNEQLVHALATYILTFGCVHSFAMLSRGRRKLKSRSPLRARYIDYRVH